MRLWLRVVICQTAFVCKQGSVLLKELTVSEPLGRAGCTVTQQFGGAGRRGRVHPGPARLPGGGDRSRDGGPPRVGQREWPPVVRVPVTGGGWKGGGRKNEIS